jgi:CRISPR-associated protein Cas1
MENRRSPLHTPRSTPFPPWQSAFAREALRRAWLSVRGNKGTAGPDGKTITEFEQSIDQQLSQLRRELLNGAYRPHRVTQVLVPKASGGWRPLSLWVVRDRIAQRAVYNYLEPVFEARFLPCSYGFRPGRTTRDAALAIQKARQSGAEWVLDADIKDCFSQMNSGRLLKQLRRWQVPRPISDLINRWLHARVWNAWSGNGKAGTSQGGAISPLLCNLYLHAFDEAMQKRHLWLIRYADDMVVLSRDKTTIHQAEQLVVLSLQKLDLELHPQKTRITHFNEGFQFVGWFFIRNEMYELR